MRSNSQTSYNSMDTTLVLSNTIYRIIACVKRPLKQSLGCLCLHIYGFWQPPCLDSNSMMGDNMYKWIQARWVSCAWTHWTCFPFSHISFSILLFIARVVALTQRSAERNTPLHLSLPHRLPVSYNSAILSLEFHLCWSKANADLWDKIKGLFIWKRASLVSGLTFLFCGPKGKEHKRKSARLPSLKPLDIVQFRR